MKKRFHEIMEDYMFGEVSKCYNRKEIIIKFVESFENDFNFKRTEFLKMIKQDENYDKLSEIISKQSINSLMINFFSKNYMDSYSYFLYKFHKNNGKVFLVDGPLSEALYNTDSTFVPDEIYFPFETFIMYIDQSTICSIGETDKNGKWYPNQYTVQYIMVNISKEEGFSNMTFMIGFLDKGEKQENFNAWNNTTLFNLTIPFGQHFKLTKSDLKHNYPSDKNISEDQLEILSKSTDRIINFILNFILYVTEVPDDYEKITPQLIDVSKRKSKSKIDQAIKLNERESKYIVHHIGKKYSGVYQKSKELTRNELTHRILVRGHWRMQWYGPKSNESHGTKQKRIWIEPFFKGPESEENKTEVFIVK